MTTEFNLSEKIHINNTNNNWTFIRIEDVKEFIRLLKEKTFETFEYALDSSEMSSYTICQEIDKLAGDKLV